MEGKVIVFKKFIGNISYQKALFNELESGSSVGIIMGAVIPDLNAFLENNKLCIEDGGIYLQNPSYKLIGVASRDEDLSTKEGVLQFE